MRLLLVIFGVVLFSGVILWTGPKNLIDSLYGINIPIFLLALVTSFVILVLVSLRFREVLYNVTGRRIGLWSAYNIFGISHLFSMVSPAKSGEFVKSYFLKRQGIGYSYGIIVVALERVLDLMAVTILMLVFGLVGATSLTVDYLKYPILLLGVILVSVVFFRSSLFVKILWRVPIISGKLREVSKGEYREVIRRNLSIRSMAIPLTINMAAITLAGSVTYLVFLSLGMNPNAITVITIYFLISVVGVLSMIPGGLGSVEVTGTWLYSSILGYEPASVATALIVSRITVYMVDIPSGIVCSFVHKDKPKLKH